jgi:hypothetical protein
MAGEDGRLAADAGTSRGEDDDESLRGEPACNIEPTQFGRKRLEADSHPRDRSCWCGGIEVKIESLTPTGVD